MVTLFASAPRTAPSGEVSTYQDVEAWRAAQQAAQPADTEQPEQQVAIINFETMRVEWSGPRSQAPAPQGVANCVSDQPQRHYRSFTVEPAILSLTLDRQTGALAAPARGAAAHCAVSADGARLVVLAPPFLHLYAVSAP